MAEWVTQLAAAELLGVHRLGFVPTRAVDDDGEVLARLPLDGPSPTRAS